MRSILSNPRYTGRQVWKRQRRDEVLVDVEDVAAGYHSKMRWNETSEWVLVYRRDARSDHRLGDFRPGPGADGGGRLPADDFSHD